MGDKLFLTNNRGTLRRGSLPQDIIRAPLSANSPSSATISRPPKPPTLAPPVEQRIPVEHGSLGSIVTKPLYGGERKMSASYTETATVEKVKRVGTPAVGRKGSLPIRMVLFDR